MGSACYGLQSLTDSWEVRRLVSALAARVEQCTQPLDAQAVGNACYGLQSLTDSWEVRRLVAALAARVSTRHALGR